MEKCCEFFRRASGSFGFDEKAFWEKIERAESKVHKLGGNEDELRKRIKQYIDGNKLMQWFPELQKDRTLIKNIMPKIQEYIINTLDAGDEPNDDDMKTIAQENIPIKENFDRIFRKAMRRFK